MLQLNQEKRDTYENLKKQYQDELLTLLDFVVALDELCSLEANNISITGGNVEMQIHQADDEGHYIASENFIMIMNVSKG